jgi:hypothetical protein
MYPEGRFRARLLQMKSNRMARVNQTEANQDRSFGKTRSQLATGYETPLGSIGASRGGFMKWSATGLYIYPLSPCARHIVGERM